MDDTPDPVIRSASEPSDPIIQRMNQQFDQLIRTMDQQFQEIRDLVRVLHDKQLSSRRAVSEDRLQQ
jgi:hypothetical protein